MQDFIKQYGPWALIAGGSEGIGLAYARQLAEKGLNLILLGRREAALQSAAQSLSSLGVEVRTVTTDLSRAPDATWLENLAKEFEIGLLIYNAGATHGAALYHDQPLEKIQALIGLNCLSPATYCHVLGQPMKARGRGGMLLMSSMSGLTGGAYIATYCASKSFDIVLAEGLYQELKPFGVDVTCLIAGATDTPAMARSGIDMSERGMDAAEVAREGLSALGREPVWIAGEQNRDAALLFRDADRKQTTSLMSQATADMFGKTFPPTR